MSILKLKELNIDGVRADLSKENDAFDESSMSNCPSCTLEDLEDPLDDDIFASRPLDHAKKVWKSLRAFVRGKRKKINEERRQMEHAADLEHNDGFTMIYSQSSRLNPSSLPLQFASNRARSHGRCRDACFPR